MGEMDRSVGRIPLVVFVIVSAFRKRGPFLGIIVKLCNISLPVQILLGDCVIAEHLLIAFDQLGWIASNQVSAWIVFVEEWLCAAEIEGGFDRGNELVF